MDIVKKIIRRIMKLFAKKYKISYSQSGEDLIVEFILNAMHIPRPKYLDLGANDPIVLNNTYLFYLKGGHGVCVEPDPGYTDRIKRARPRDDCLQVGVGEHAGQADFYVMSSRTLNTFSREVSEKYTTNGNQKIEEVVKIPLRPVNDILEKCFKECPNFVSIDIEGLEIEILKTLDFERFRPEVFCIETITYTEEKSERKISEIIEFMSSKDYFLYADTYINSIFVDRKSWKNRG